MIIVDGTQPITQRFSIPYFDERSTNLTVSPCQNPFCDCSYLTLLFSEKFNSEGYPDTIWGVINANIAKQELSMDFVPADITEEQTHFSNLQWQFMLAQMDQSDWDLLTNDFELRKMSQIANTISLPDEELFEYIKTRQDLFLEKKLRIDYATVFPHARRFSVEVENDTYSLQDSYIKSIKVKKKVCFLDVTKNGQYLTSIKFNFEDKTTLPDKEYTWLITLFEETHPEFLQTLTNRSLSIQVLHSKLLIQSLESKKKKMDTDSKQAIGSLAKKKLGRNEVCHCGSGKKYKKCCMNK